jgi:hypothetical protein
MFDFRHDDDAPADEAPLAAALLLIVGGTLLMQADSRLLALPRRRNTLERARRRYRRGDRLGAAAQESRDRILDLMPRNLAAGIGRTLVFAGVGMLAVRLLDLLSGDD